MKTKWDIVDDLGTNSKNTNTKSIGRTRRAQAALGLVATSLCAVTFLLTSPSASSGQYRLAGPNPVSASFFSSPSQIINIKRSPKTERGRDQRVDTKVGLTSRQLANRFSTFFKPADPEAEDTSDYSFM